MMGEFLVEVHHVVEKEEHIRKIHFFRNCCSCCCFFFGPSDIIITTIILVVVCLFVYFSFFYITDESILRDLEEREKMMIFTLVSFSLCVIVFVIVILDFSTLINLKTIHYLSKNG
jgi:hypothetical protein